MSMAGKLDDSMNYLQVAWDKGYKEIRHINQDDDLHELRKGKPYEFEKLTDIKLGVDLQFGNIWNDVVFKNKQDYDLDDVFVLVEVEHMLETYAEVYFIHSLSSGGEIRFQGVFDKCSSRGKGKYSLFCAQEECKYGDFEIKDVIGEYSGFITRIKQDGSDVRETNPIKIIFQVGEDGKLACKSSFNHVNKKGLPDFVVGNTLRLDNLMIRFYGKEVVGLLVDPEDKDFFFGFWAKRK